VSSCRVTSADGAASFLQAILPAGVKVASAARARICALPPPLGGAGMLAAPGSSAAGARILLADPSGEEHLAAAEVEHQYWSLTQVRALVAMMRRNLMPASKDHDMSVRKHPLISS
jgi:hypothetical protein